MSPSDLSQRLDAISALLIVPKKHVFLKDIIDTKVSAQRQKYWHGAAVH